MATDIQKANWLRKLAIPLLLLLVSCGGGTPMPQRAQSGGATAAVIQAADGDIERSVQKLYLAYFGRPADLQGLQFWSQRLKDMNAGTDPLSWVQMYSSNAGIREIIDIFGNSSESTNLYPGPPEDFVRAVYRNLFGRAPDSGGLEFWSTAISSNRLTKGNAALTILAAAQGSDAEIVEAKVTVAVAFSATLRNEGLGSIYSGADANQKVRAMLDAIDQRSHMPTVTGQIVPSMVDTLATTTGLYYVQPIISADLMASMEHRPVKIVAGTAIAAIGQPLPLPALAPGEDTPILVTDEEDNVVLAGTSFDPALTVESTAITLVRLGLGWKLPGLSAQETIAKIRDEYAFRTFLLELKEAVRLVGGPLMSERMRMYLNHFEATFTVGPQPPIPRLPVYASSTKLTAAGAAVPRATPPLPITVAGHGLNTVQIVGGGLQMKNNSLIAWSVRPTDLMPDQAVRLPPATFSQRFGGKASEWLNVPTIKVPNAGGRNFELTVEQTTATRRENFVAVVVGVISQVIKLTLQIEPDLQQCEAAVAGILAQDNEFARLMGQTDKDAAQAYLLTLLSPKNYWTLASHCTPRRDNLFKNSFPVLAKTTAKFALQFARIEAVAGASTLTAKIATSLLYFGARETFLVCEAPELSGYTVVNCADKFGIAEKSPVMLASGAIHQPETTAWVGNKQTGVPAGLKYTSSHPGVVSVDRETGKLEAKSRGYVSITIEDELTGARGRYYVNVPELRLSTDKYGIDVGDTNYFRIVDGLSGTPVKVPSTGYTWLPQPEGSAIGTEPLLALWMPSALGYRALKPGTAQVAVRLPDGKEILRSITVYDMAKIPLDTFGEYTVRVPFGSCWVTENGTLKLYGATLDASRPPPWRVTVRYTMTGFEQRTYDSCRLLDRFSLSGVTELVIDAQNRLTIVFPTHTYAGQSVTPPMFSGVIGESDASGKAIIKALDITGTFTMQWRLPSPLYPKTRP